MRLHVLCVRVIFMYIPCNAHSGANHNYGMTCLAFLVNVTLALQSDPIKPAKHSFEHANELLKFYWSM